MPVWKQDDKSRVAVLREEHCRRTELQEIIDGESGLDGLLGNTDSIASRKNAQSCTGGQDGLPIPAKET